MTKRIPFFGLDARPHGRKSAGESATRTGAAFAGVWADGRKALVLCVVALWVFGAAPAIASIADNRLVNPGAEDALVGWQGTGFGSVGYEESGVPRFPEPNFVPGSAPDLGVRLFAATADAAIWQTVDVSDLAARIDSGAQPLSIGGLLGGRGGQEGGARLVAQPLDAAGAALGAPYVAGRPTDRDRQSRTALLPCSIYNQIAPVGTRAVLVRLEAVGHGLADRLFLATERFLPNAALHPPTRVADGPGCSTGERVGPWPPGSPSQDPPPASSEDPLVVSLVTRSAKLLGRTVRLQLRCPRGGQCTGVVRLRTAVRVRSASRQRMTLGAKTFQIPANGRRTTPIMVSRRIARALRTRSRVPLNAFITSRDEAGRSTFSRERVTLRTR